MRTTSALAAIVAAVPFVSAAVDISSIPRVSSATYVPGKYIVELSGASELAGSSGAKRSFSPHSVLKKRGSPWDVEHEFDEDGVFVGAMVAVNDEAGLIALADTDGVKSIHAVSMHRRPEPVNTHVPAGPTDPRLPADMFSTHKMTGVDKLHAEGILGKGVKIGILDTGIDWTHKTLGGGFGAGFKIYGGYDFVGDNYGTGDNPPVPDDDPLDQCAGHGTHVAGIIGANLDPVYNFTGVAPEASLASYRVFGCKGGVGDDVLVKALLRAHKDGNDVITLSLGGAQGWTSTVTAVVASRIASAGRIVTIAAGNDGAYGSWYASSPGTAEAGFGVASVENTETMVQTVFLDNGHAPIGYGSFKPLNVTGSLPVYATSNDTTITDDACKPLLDSTPDLSQYLVLIKRGGCTFVEKLGNAAAKGMKAALIYDNVPGINGGIAVGNYTAAIITLEDGKYLVGEVAAGRTVRVTFPQDGGIKVIESPTGGLMSAFSSFGPTSDLFFKPSIAAPGGNILSTIPIKLGGYEIESGTSMATPFMAGSAALLLQYKKKSKQIFKDARTIFETTAVAVASSKTDGDAGQTLAQTGAGLVNVYNALHYKTTVWPAELTLNDTAHAKMLHTITVTNHHKTVQLYNVTHVPAGTALTMNGTEPIPFPVPLVKNYATMTQGAQTLKLKPGETKKFIVKFTAPQGLDAKQFPVYSGHIVIQSADERLGVSYLGVAAAMKDMQVLDTSKNYFDVPLPQLLDGAGSPQNVTTTYTFDSTSFPTVVYRMVAGSPAVRLDLLDAATSAVVGNVAEALYKGRNSNGDAKNNGYETIAWDATFKNGTTVANGTYKFKLSALRITGDRTKASDWETWVSPTFVVEKEDTTATGTATASSVVTSTQSTPVTSTSSDVTTSAVTAPSSAAASPSTTTLH